MKGSLSSQEAVLANASAPGHAAEDREPINNVEALEEALEDIAWPADVSWLEAQVSLVEILPLPVLAMLCADHVPHDFTVGPAELDGTGVCTA